MDFIVHTAEARLVLKDASFTIKDNGTLVVRDPSRDKLTTFSPSGWLKIEQKLPAPPPPPPGPQAVR